MSKDKALQSLCRFLGLAAKAGRIQSGEFCTEKSVKSGKAKLCIVASDASAATKKMFSDMCVYRGVPVYTDLIDKDTLGHVIGRGMRASAAVEDDGFAAKIRSMIEDESPEKGGPAERYGQEGGNADGK